MDEGREERREEWREGWREGMTDQPNPQHHCRAWSGEARKAQTRALGARGGRTAFGQLMLLTALRLSWTVSAHLTNKSPQPRISVWGQARPLLEPLQDKGQPRTKGPCQQRVPSSGMKAFLSPANTKRFPGPIPPQPGGTESAWGSLRAPLI